MSERKLTCGGCIGNSFWGKHDYDGGCAFILPARKWYYHADERHCFLSADGGWRYRPTPKALSEPCERHHNDPLDQPAEKPESNQRPAFEVALDEALAEVRELMISRHRKYGPGNIARHGETGILVRLGDKYERLDNNSDDLSDESVDDTIDDVIGYGVIWKMWRKGTWPK